MLAPVDLTALGIPYAGLKRYGTYILTLWLVTAVAAMGVNLIVGYAGQETLAQAAFLGIGAYTTALMTKAGMPFAAAFLASGLAAFVVGIALGFPALRVQKHYLAFVTLAFSVFVWLVIRNEEWLTGGVSGIANIPPSLAVRAQPEARALLLLVHAGDCGRADLRHVVAAALALGPRLHGVAREPAAGREPRRRRARLHAAGVRHRLGLRRVCRRALCAARRVHRPRAVRARAFAACSC